MYKCAYCPQTSKKKWNIQVHEARKHSSTNKNDTNQMQDENPMAMQSEDNMGQSMDREYRSKEEELEEEEEMKIVDGVGATRDELLENSL